MNILFINGSPNREGNTAHLAETFLEGHDYDSLQLTDYKMNFLGQAFEGDQLQEVVDKVKKYDTIVLGSPLYFASVSGIVRNLFDRFYVDVPMRSFQGRLFFLFQGASPEDWMFEKAEYTIQNFGKMTGLTYMGMANTEEEAKKLAKNL